MAVLRSQIPESSYCLTKDAAIKELGRKAYDRLVELRRWLYGPTGNLTFRPAPSVIARSEAELFGLSSPRFALRTTLTEQSFVNARRLAKFVQNASAACKEPPRVSTSPEGASPVRITARALRNELLRPGQCVADSLLKLPTRLASEGYIALECELGRAYGEGVCIQATPFLQHTTLGGGMCAQAVCFMLLALNEGIVKSVLGIAEITAIARGGEGLSLDLSGMDRGSIVRFLNDPKVGLSAYEQIAGHDRRHAAIAMHSYLSSGVPLILPVDLGRMWGDIRGKSKKSLVEKNDVRLRRRKQIFRKERLRRQDHVVAIVGFDPSNCKKYLLNDPATYPFLKADIEDIYSILPYEECPQGIPPEAEQARLTFISATHPNVKLPLLSVAGERRKSCGLLEIAAMVQTGASGGDIDFPCFRPNAYDFGRFFLVDVARPLDEVMKPHWPLPRITTKTLEQAIQASGVPRQWYWLQYIPPASFDNENGSITLWDAEKAPCQSTTECSSYVTALFRVEPRTGIATCTWSRHSLPQQSVSPDLARDETGNDNFSAIDTFKIDASAGDFISIVPSLLSSFCTSGASSAHTDLLAYDSGMYREEGCKSSDNIVSRVSAEVYLFMEQETKEWIAEFGSWWRFWKMRDLSWKWRSPLNAVDFLARLDSREIDSITDRLADRFSFARSPIVAIASFVPEITRPPRQPQGSPAAQAIRNLILIAQALQQKGHPTRYVELVAGSAIEGIWMAREPKEHKFYASLLRQQEARSRLLSNLRSALREISHDKWPVYLALELEPGPCFVLRDWDSLLQLAIDIEQDDTLRHRVGFNLDIGHWRIAQINCANIHSFSHVRDRVVHAHINAHHRCAHFGDAPFVNLDGSILDHNQPEDFLPWLNLLKKIAIERLDAGQLREGSLEFSRHVSMELEATKNNELVLRSFRKLVDLTQHQLGD
jgi:hypothetical protein